MARKPLSEKTVAENCLKWGTGGINIDESRVEADIKNDPNYRPNASQHKGHGSSFSIQGDGQRSKEDLPDEGFHNSPGRFPANLILEDCEEVRECFPETKSGAMNGTYKNTMMKGVPGVRDGKEIHLYQEASSGNASRFFKSIITDKLCTLCCLPFDIKHDTMSVCKNTNVNNAEKSLKTTQATIESTALKNATG